MEREENGKDLLIVEGVGRGGIWGQRRGRRRRKGMLRPHRVHLVFEVKIEAVRCQGFGSLTELPFLRPQRRTLEAEEDSAAAAFFRQRALSGIVSSRPGVGPL